MPPHLHPHGRPHTHAPRHRNLAHHPVTVIECSASSKSSYEYSIFFHSYLMITNCILHIFWYSYSSAKEHSHSTTAIVPDWLTVRQTLIRHSLACQRSLLDEMRWNFEYSSLASVTTYYDGLMFIQQILMQLGHCVKWNVRYSIKKPTLWEFYTMEL